MEAQPRARKSYDLKSFVTYINTHMHNYIHIICDLYADDRFMVYYTVKLLWTALNHEQVRADSEVTADKTMSNAGHRTSSVRPTKICVAQLSSFRRSKRVSVPQKEEFHQAQQQMIHFWPSKTREEEGI